MVTFNDIIKAFQNTIFDNFYDKTDVADYYNQHKIENFNFFKEYIWKGLRDENSWLYDIDELNYTTTKASWRNRCLTKVTETDVSQNIKLDTAVQNFIYLYYAGTSEDFGADETFILRSDLEFKNPFLGDNNNNVITSDLNWNFKIYRFWDKNDSINLSVKDVTTGNDKTSYMFSITSGNTQLLQHSNSYASSQKINFDKRTYFATQFDKPFTITFKLNASYTIDETKTQLSIGYGGSTYKTFNLSSYTKEGTYDILKFDVTYEDIVDAENFKLEYYLDYVSFKNFNTVNIYGLEYGIKFSNKLSSWPDAPFNFQGSGVINNYCILIPSSCLGVTNMEYINRNKRAFGFILNEYKNEIFFSKETYNNMINEAAGLSFPVYLVLSCVVFGNSFYEVVYRFDKLDDLKRLEATDFNAFLNMSTAFNNNYIGLKASNTDSQVNFMGNKLYDNDTKSFVITTTEKYFPVLSRGMSIKTILRHEFGLTFEDFNGTTQTQKLTSNSGSYTLCNFNEKWKEVEFIRNLGKSRDSRKSGVISEKPQVTMTLTRRS